MAVRAQLWMDTTWARYLSGGPAAAAAAAAAAGAAVGAAGGATTITTAAAAATTTGTSLSKKETKRQQRLQRTKEKWKEKKQAAKAKKKRKSQEQREAAAAAAAASGSPALPAKRKPEDMTAEELARREEARARREQRKADFRAACANGVRVAIDLSFEDKMLDREVTSLVQQIMYCYGVNNRSSKPFRFCLTSMGGATEEKLRNIVGFSTWPIFPDSRPYLEAFKKEDIVYLSADAEHTVETVDPSKVYVIGGIVDRNRYPGLTHNNAVAAGVRTEKLPIAAFMKLNSSSVLTCNHSFEILNHFAVHGSWEKAFFSAIPRRKNLEGSTSRKKRRMQRSSGGGGGGGGGGNSGGGGATTGTGATTAGPQAAAEPTVQPQAEGASRASAGGAAAAPCPPSAAAAAEQ